MADIVKITFRTGGEGSPVLTVKGRSAWALDKLIKAGARGCTKLDTPVPNLAAYVFELRRAGLAIETVDEPHGGAYAGMHGRYFLRSAVEIIAEAREVPAGDARP